MSPADYWRMVRKQAWIEARRMLHLENTVAFWLSVGGAVLVIILLWVWVSRTAAIEEMIGTGVITAVTILALPLIWMWKCRTVPARLYTESQSRIKQLEIEAASRLQIEGVYQDRNYRWTDFHETRRDYRCSIAVRNLSSNKEIENVTVRIIRFSGGEDFDVPQTLIPKHQTINAGVEQNWIVASGSHVALGEEVNLKIHVDYHGGPFQTFANKIEMTIEASAAGVPPATRDFVLCRDEERRPMLIPKNEVND